jgi:DNA-binding CsgD family transcriptional regulator/tetratricopeptide (TPR) repeat protein
MVLLPGDGLVGRDRELDIAADLVRGLDRGAAAAVLIEGEAGIGKTRLVHAIADDAARRGVRVLRGGAHPFERNRPFGAVAQALDLRRQSSDRRRVAIAELLAPDPDDPASPRPVDVRYRVVDEIVDLVEASCARAPHVLVLEDLHWADDSSLLAVRGLMRSLGHVPLLIVATLRPAPRALELDQLLDECDAAGARRLSLGSLRPADVEELVQVELGLPPGPLLTAILAKAGGNPLWLVEILRSLSSEGWLRRDEDAAEATADELPGSLRELVLRRLRYLPEDALDLLQLTSVLGEAVSVHDLAVVARRPAPAVMGILAEAFRARLLDERDDALVFRHQLVQEAIYEELPKPVRRALHRDAAGALARAGADLAAVAGHLIRGADRGDLEAVRWLRQAASVVGAGAPATAVDMVRQALGLLPAGHADVDVTTAELAEALQRAGQVAEASRVAEAALDRPHRAEADVPLRLTLVSSLSLQNRAVELIERAESALRSSALTLPQKALVLTQASYGRTFSGDFLGGEATARRALDAAERSGAVEMTVWSLAALSVPVRMQGRYADALALTRRAVTLAFDPVDNGARLRHPHFFLAMVLADADRTDEARAAYGRAIEEAEELGTGWLLPDMLLLAAELRFLVGEWSDADVELEAGLQLAQAHGQRISINQSRAYQAVIATGRGDLAAARTALASVDDQLTAENPTYGAEMVALASSLVAEAGGDLTAAHDVLLRAWNRDVARDVRYYHRYLGPSLVRLSLALDRREVAVQVVGEIEAGAALASEVDSVQGAAMRCRGLLDQDPDLLAGAAELTGRSPRILDHAGACEDAAAALTAAARTEEAVALLVKARARYECVEATAWMARVDAGLRRLGIKQGARGPRRRAQTGPASLTASERAVSELVAEGLTNREVGRRLHISPHTVNTHLRHVFQKLSVSTRAELAAHVARSDITRSSDDSAGAGADTSR